jgi:hypothetical protein
LLPAIPAEALPIKANDQRGCMWVKRVLDDVGQGDFGHPSRFSLISE